MENHHLEALPKQDKNQVEGTKKSKILKQIFKQILKQSQTCSITGDNPKNAQMASTPGGQAANNTEIINVLNFIQQITEMLSAYNEQLKGKLDINLTHQDML